MIIFKLIFEFIEFHIYNWYFKIEYQKQFKPKKKIFETNFKLIAILSSSSIAVHQIIDSNNDLFCIFVQRITFFSNYWTKNTNKLVKVITKSITYYLRRQEKKRSINLRPENNNKILKFYFLLRKPKPEIYCNNICTGLHSWSSVSSIQKRYLELLYTRPRVDPIKEKAICLLFTNFFSKKNI